MTILESVALGKDRNNRRVENNSPSKKDGRIADKGLKVCPKSVSYTHLTLPTSDLV